MTDPMYEPDQQTYQSSKTIAVYAIKTAGIAAECFIRLQVELKKYLVGFCNI